MPSFNAGPPERLLCLDIETIPDRLRLPPDQGERFPKPIHHEVVCVSFVEAEITIDGNGYERYEVVACRSGGEPGWDEVQLLQSFWCFFSRRPTRIVTWNGRSFDVPVLLQRSMVHGLTAAGWYTTGSRYEGYTHRFSDSYHCDLMDVIADRGACPKLSLDEGASALGLPGKLGGHGSEVEAMVARGEIEQVRRYCECDTLNLAGLYARHALLTGRMSKAGHDAAIESLRTYLDGQRAARPHLGEFLDRWQARGAGERA